MSQSRVSIPFENLKQTMYFIMDSNVLILPRVSRTVSKYSFDALLGHYMSVSPYLSD